MENVLRDMTLAVRGLRKEPRTAAVAILTLALGIGAATIVFSVAYNVFFHVLPYRDFSRDVVFRIENVEDAGGWKGRGFFFPDEYRAIRDRNHVFEDVMAYNGVRVVYSHDAMDRYLPGGDVVTPNAFAFLGVRPLLGRAIEDSDARAGAAPVFVMSYKLWHEQFGGDAGIIGKSFVLDGQATTLIGVMPREFEGFGASFWMPASADEAGGEIIGRLKRGASVVQAQADLDILMHQLQKANPAGIFPEKFRVVAESLRDNTIGGFEKTLYALLGAVALLLLIACSNVANLLLSRATAREREMAVRAALGATRWRLARQLLAESFVSAAAAAAIGSAFAYFGLKIVVAMLPSGTVPDASVIRMNIPVLLLAMGMTLVTAILCGLAPAVHVANSDLQPRLASAGKGATGGARHGRLRAALVIGEVALSIVLLCASGILMRSFLVMTQVNLGFDPANVAYFQLSFQKAYSWTPGDSTSAQEVRARKNNLTRQLLARLRGIPGVSEAAESTMTPPLNYDWSDTIIPGRPHTERWETRYESVSEGYFETLGIPLLRGRFFTTSDLADERKVMVVNEAFARQYFPNQDPLGRKVKLQVLDRPFLDAPHDAYFEVVGVAANYKTRNDEKREWEDFPEAFFPYSVQGFSWRTYLMRTTVDPNSLWKESRSEVQAIDPALDIAISGTLEGSLREYYRGPRFELATLASFAAAGLSLAMIGIFSVMAYTVSLRTHEIGVRVALGAQRGDIVRLVLGEGLGLVIAGVLIGLAASYATTRFLASEISGVSVTDSLTFAAVVAIVIAAGAAACVAPARRATAVDPMVALRHE